MPVVGQGVSVLDAILSAQPRAYTPAGDLGYTPAEGFLPLGAASPPSASPVIGPAPSQQNPAAAGSRHPLVDYLLGSAPAALAQFAPPPPGTLTQAPINPLVSFLGSVGQGFQAGRAGEEDRETTEFRRAVRGAPSTKKALDTMIGGDEAAVAGLTPGQLFALKAGFGVEPEFLGGAQRQMGAQVAAGTRPGAEGEAQRAFTAGEAKLQREFQGGQADLDRALQDKGLRMEDEYRDAMIKMHREIASDQADVDYERIAAGERINETNAQVARQGYIATIDDARYKSITEGLRYAQTPVQASAWTKLVNNTYAGAADPTAGPSALSPEEIAALGEMPNADLIRAQAQMARAAAAHNTTVQHFESLVQQEWGSIKGAPPEVRRHLASLQILGQANINNLGPEAQDAIATAWDYFIRHYRDQIGDAGFLERLSTGTAFSTPEPGPRGPGLGGTRDVDAEIQQILQKARAEGRTVTEAEVQQLRKLKREKTGAASATPAQ